MSTKKKSKTVNRIYNNADIGRVRRNLKLDDSSPSGMTWIKSRGPRGAGQPASSGRYISVEGWAYQRIRVEKLLRTGIDPGPLPEVDERWAAKKAAKDSKPKTALRKLGKGLYLLNDSHLLTVTNSGDIEAAEVPVQ